MSPDCSCLSIFIPFKFIKYWSTRFLHSSNESLEDDELEEDGLEDGLDELELGAATELLGELEEAGWLELEDAGLELAELLSAELGALLLEELSSNNFVDTSSAKSSPDEVVVF